MRKNDIKTMAVLLCVAMVFAACTTEQGESKESKKKGKGKSVSDMIKDDIGLLASTTDWAEAQQMYKRVQVDIRDNVKNELTQDDLKTLANRGYCRSMDTIMRIILKGECEPRHGELKALHAERQKFDVKSGLHDEVEQMYKTHEEIDEFVRKARGNRQKVASYEAAYDKDTETKLKGEATNYLNSGVKCAQLKGKLKKIEDGTAFNGRRKAFCDAVVRLYVESGNYTAASHKTVRAKIVNVGTPAFFNKSGQPLNADAESWIEDLDNFESEHKNN